MIEISNSDVIANQCQQLATLVMRHTEGNALHATAIEQLSFGRSDATSSAIYSVDEPRLTLIVQGKKEMLLGEETYPYYAGQYQVLSVALPLSGCVVEATPDKPCLMLKLSLDLVQLCGLVSQMGFSSAKQENSVRGLWVSNADAYQVGYESSSQFSREYARMFGAPPMRDIERLRTA